VTHCLASSVGTRSAVGVPTNLSHFERVVGPDPAIFFIVRKDPPLPRLGFNTWSLQFAPDPPVAQGREPSILQRGQTF
jgi:hypothetical protein